MAIDYVKRTAKPAARIDYVKRDAKVIPAKFNSDGVRVLQAGETVNLSALARQGR